MDSRCPYCGRPNCPMLRLTNREREIVMMLAKAPVSIAAMAGPLKITNSTLKNLMWSIYKKMGGDGEPMTGIQLAVWTGAHAALAAQHLAKRAADEREIASLMFESPYTNETDRRADEIVAQYDRLNNALASPDKQP